MQHAIPHLASLCLNERLGRLDVGFGRGRVERGLAELGVDALGVGLAEARADVLGELRNRVEAHVHGEVLVDLGKLLVLDLLDGHLEGGIRTRQLLAWVVGRKGQLDRAGLPRRGALQALLEAGDQIARAELDELIAPLPALERLARDRAEVVDHDEVA